MNARLRLASLAALAALTLTAAPRRAGATGQCDADDVRVTENLGHPDYLPDFAAGKLGVVFSGFPRAFLATAYLTLNGVHLDRATQDAVVGMWLDRNHVARVETGPDPVAAWTTARKKIAGAPAPAALDVYSGDSNCLADTFLGATRTLERLRQQPGFTAAELADWATAQDQVFAFCAFRAPDAPTVPALPADLPDSASPAARAERTYQIAAAHFYAGHHVLAADLFARIGRDKTSPWAPWGPYLSARAFLRCTLFDNDLLGLEAARVVLAPIAADTSAPDMQRRAQSLLNVILIRKQPVVRLRAAAAALHQPGAGFVNDLTDFLLGLDLLLADGQQSQQVLIDPKELAPLLAADDLTDWVVSMQQAPNNPSAKLDHDLARYDEKHAEHWLVAAISAINLDHPRARELIAAADKVARTSPAFDTVTFQSLRLLATSKLPADQATFAARVDAELKARASDPQSTLVNQLLDWRQGFSTTLAEMLAVSVRFELGAEGCGFAQAAAKAPPTRAAADHLVSPRLALVLERGAPLARLVTLLDDPALPATVKPGLKLMVWERALLLGENDASVQAMVDKLEPVVPSNAKFDAAMKAAHAAATPEARRFELALFYLANGWLDPVSIDGPAGGHPLFVWCPPGNPDSYDESGNPDDTDEVKAALHKAADGDAQRFFTPAERKQGAAEVAKLDAMGGGFAVVVGWTLAYAALHPEDPRLPRALYDINVASKRVHCNSTGWSKKAFLFMHDKYPNDPLTKKVQYWY